MFSLPLALLHNLFIQQSWKSSGELSAFCSATDQLQGHKYQGWKKKKNQNAAVNCGCHQHQTWMTFLINCRKDKTKLFSLLINAKEIRWEKQPDTLVSKEV